MKYRVLFAKTGIAKFMALLVTLAMFASCNFVGGEDARTPTAGRGDHGKLNGVFKNAIHGGISISIDGDEHKDYELTFTCDELPRLDGRSDGWWSGGFGWWVEETPDNWKYLRKYDVSGIVACSFEVTAHTDVKNLEVTVFRKIDEKSVESEWENKESERKVGISLESGKTKRYVKKFDAAFGKSRYRGCLISFAGGNAGESLSITNITFYDKDGNEVVPQSIEEL